MDINKMTTPTNSQIIIYRDDVGNVKLDVRLDGETVWLTQKMMAELYQVTLPTINEHIKNIVIEGELDQISTIRKFRIVQNEGNRKVSREIDFCNLDMILSVGYRVKSAIATQFRIWATKTLKEYIIKGFVLDDERLKNPDLPNELLTLNNLVEQYLVFAEGQAMRRIPMTMKDWIEKLHGFLQLNDRNILNHAGKVSHELAKELAESEYDKFHEHQLKLQSDVDSDFEKIIAVIEKKKLKHTLKNNRT